MKLIDKAAVVSKIEELDEFWHLSKSPDGQAFIESLLSFLDNIEVKEVDLEKEFDEYTKDIWACDIQLEPFTHLFDCAKHFFELGMQQSKKDNDDEKN